MKTFRILLYSFVLALTNIVSVIAGFGVYHLLKPANQITLQAPAAVLLCIAGFLGWSLAIRHCFVGDLTLPGRSESLWTFIYALFWSPVIFTPLHYIGRGYLTSFGNILGLWLFQIPANFLALMISYKVLENIGLPVKVQKET